MEGGHPVDWLVASTGLVDEGRGDMPCTLLRPSPFPPMSQSPLADVPTYLWPPLDSQTFARHPDTSPTSPC